jgi:signal peptide peptidase SppA
MNKQHTRIAERIYNRPWLISDGGYFKVHSVYQGYINAKHAGDMKAWMDDSSSTGTAQPYVTIGKVAVVSLEGTILKHASLLEQMCGAADVDTFLNNVRAAFNDTNIESILLDINSPGGEVTGVKEAADAIREMAQTKEIVAFTDSLCASAAYWIASACNSIFTTETANIGSIGVFTLLYDWSAAYAIAGVKPVLIKDGAFKADGVEGLPISDDTIARLQTDVLQIGTMFRSAVNINRDVADSTMQGQCFMGMNAVGLGLVDYIVTDMNELISLMNADLN